MLLYRDVVKRALCQCPDQSGDVFAVWLSTLAVKNAQIDWLWLTITQLIEFAFFVFAVGAACFARRAG